MAEWWQWAEEAAAMFLPLWRQFLKPGDLAFDIGGNVGRMTSAMRRLGARVVFVEPMLAFGPEFVPEFWWRWAKDRDVIQVPKAVTWMPEVTISINQFMPEYSSIDTAWMTESSHSPAAGQSYYNAPSLIQRQVPGVTLDTLIRVYGLPAFMKVDVEGHENAAIGTLHQAVPALNMEFHADWIPVRAMERLDSLGAYEWNYCLDGGGKLVLPEWVGRGEMLDYMQAHLTRTGLGSWGDVYGRLAD
jgi:FkbM family methyltransferase